MEYSIFRSEQRGRFENEWLRTRFSFSFSNWYEPSRMGFGVLRVLNDDIIAPKNGFGYHPHQNMEIITIIKNGELTHKDDFGNSGTISKGEVQVMSPGTGVVHSEINEGIQEVELFQIWLKPKNMNISPRYDQMHFDWESANQWVCVVSPLSLPMKNSLQINQEAFINLGVFEAGSIQFETHLQESAVYMQVIEGQIKWEDQVLEKGDGMEIPKISVLKLNSDGRTKLMIIEMPVA